MPSRAASAEATGRRLKWHGDDHSPLIRGELQPPRSAYWAAPGGSALGAKVGDGVIGTRRPPALSWSHGAGREPCVVGALDRRRRGTRARGRVAAVPAAAAGP